MIVREIFHRRPRTVRNSALLTLLIGGALTAGFPAYPQDNSSKQKVPNLKEMKAGSAKALSLTPAGAPLSASQSPRASAAALLSTGTTSRAAKAQAGPISYFVVRVEFDSPDSRGKLRVPGATPLIAFDRFAEVFVPTNKAGQGADPKVMRAIIDSPGFRWFDYPEEIEVPPRPPLKIIGPARGVPEEIVHGGLAGLTGKGVIVAVLDSGIDFRNPDFISYDRAGQPTSRLLYLWDSFSTAFDTSGFGTKPPYSFPNGNSIGTLYTREQLNAELRSRGRRIPATDESGHGTAAAGIATGNGNNSKAYAGVAPDAEIIGVRFGREKGFLENAFLLNAAVDWVDGVAKREGKPVVFSCSFGGHSGGHDGESVEERELNARFSANVPGRAIVLAAGNEQHNGLHSRQLFRGKDQKAVFLWNSEESAFVSLFIRSQTGAVLDITKLRTASLVSGSDTYPEPKFIKAYANPLSKDIVAQFESPAGWAGIALWNSTEKPTEADAYVLGGVFHTDLQRAFEIVGMPGTASAAITVGSYDWNDQFNYQGQVLSLQDACGKAPMSQGDLSCYSSIGYSRGGSVKPEIVAPGQWYSSSYAKNPDGTGIRPEEHYVDSSGNYMLFNGTSAATPYTAGIVALIMQKKPTITAGEIKSLLQRNATQDTLTDKVPNQKWGYGKLDLRAVRATLNAIK